MEVYSEDRGFATADRPERRGVSRRSVIDTAKVAVPTIDLADLLCGPGQMKRIGEKWTARCPLPSHEDRSPSFVVYPGGRGWFCYGCLRGGDVVKLAALAWEIDRADVAAAEVLMTFGHEIPARPESWFRKQERQAPVRTSIEAARMRLARERLYRRFFAPLVEAVPDPEVRAQDEQNLWEATEPLARLIVANMMSGVR